jgi:hypothetical protein
MQCCVVALLVAAVLWQSPAALHVPNGDTRAIEIPAGVTGRLVFRARAHHWRPAGSNPLLRLRVNGRDVGPMRDRRVTRVARAPEFGRDLGRFDFGRWRVAQGPRAGGEYALDVADLVRSGAPTVVDFGNAAAGALGAAPLVIEDLRVESAPALPPLAKPPKWRTPRLGAPAPPRYAADATATEVRLAWNGVARVVRTTVAGGAHAFARRIERFPTRVEVRDTFTNTTEDTIGLHVRHAVATDADWIHLGGRTDPDVAFAYSPWNPTVFTPVGTAGLGLVAEDDVLRQQLFVDFEEGDAAAAHPAGTAGLRTDTLCLPAGGRVTLVWSVYPTVTPSYWDFINTVRADWGVNRTVEGSFTWFTPDAILAMPVGALRAALARQGTSIAAMFGGWVDPKRTERPPLIGFGTAVLGAPFADFRERLRQAVARLKEARPGIRVLVYFDPQRDSAPGAARRFAASTLVGLDGELEVVDFGGAFSPSVGMVPGGTDGLPSRGTEGSPPAGNDDYSRALDDVVRAMRDLGADGLYWDEMDGVDFRLPRITTRTWDGHTCALADDGTVETKLGLVNLLGDAVKERWADAGLTLGNVPPTTRRFTARADLRMVEAESAAEPWGPMAHLTTPLAYVGNRRDFAAVREKIDEGLLPIGARLDLAHDVAARLFPFQPEFLQPGTLRGRERIVTTEPGTHGWRECAGEIRVFRYDGGGREHLAGWHVKRRRGGAFVRVTLAPGELAILECDRTAPH